MYKRMSDIAKEKLYCLRGRTETLLLRASFRTKFYTAEMRLKTRLGDTHV